MIYDSHNTGLNIEPMPSTVGVYSIFRLVARVHVVWFHEEGDTKAK